VNFCEAKNQSDEKRKRTIEAVGAKAAAEAENAIGADGITKTGADASSVIGPAGSLE
jgi:hypothetical protein